MLILLVLLASCRRGAVEPLPSEAPTPTTLTGGQSGEATYAPIVTVTRAALQPTPTSRCAPDPNTSSAQYDVDTTIDMDNRAATTTMHASYRNDTGQPLQQIVLMVEPNRKPGAFTLGGVESEDPTVIDKYTLTGPRLEILLKTPLEIHCRAAFMLRFTVRLSPMQEGYVNGKAGYFAYSERQINLGEWLPVIAPLVNGDWLIPKQWPLGEYAVSTLADYTAQVKVHRSETSEAVEVIGPGEVERVSADTWRFTFAEARSFNISVDTGISKLTAASDDGVVIDLYYFAKGQPVKAPDGSPISGPQHALDTARAAVNRYTKLYGPSPYSRIVVVEGDFPDGMEFSGLVFVGHEWFGVYDGKLDSWLTLITAHEIAHQWFYALVGNDQGEAPYLDEALALYSEVLYLEDRYPSLVPWWWNFRVKMYQPQGYVDSKIYDFQNLRLYINAVYLRGASMLQEIREALGDETFFKWLRAYVGVEARKLATPADLWSAMSLADYARTADIRVKYLRQPDPLHLTPAMGVAATQAAAAPATNTARSSSARAGQP